MGGRTNRRAGAPATKPGAPARPKSTFPRRDADGRVAGFGDLLVAAVVALFIGVAAVIAIDLAASLTGMAHFGSTSGWLAGILALWLYIEEFRAWRGVRIRWAILLGATAVAVGAGGVTWSAVSAASFGHLPLVNGAAGVTAAALCYAPAWFLGIRWAQ